MRRLLLVSLVLLLGGIASGTPPTNPVFEVRRAHAARVVGLAKAARDARLGSVALRLYRDALGLDPENSEARLALGWTRDGSAAWKAPDPRVLPGEGWPDDGEADLVRLAKKEAALQADLVKDLLAAGTAARAAKDAAAADRLLWAAVGVDPRDPTPRRMLGHVARDGGFLAREHEDLAAGGGAYGRREALRQEILSREPGIRPSPAPATRPTGWATPVPAGQANAAGDVVHSLTDPGFAAEIATALARARGLAEALVGAAPEAGQGLRFLHVGARDLGNALIDAEPTMDRDARAWARVSAAWPLGRTGWTLLVAPSASEAVDAAVTAVVERLVAARGGGARAPRWLTQGAAQVVTGLLLGTPRGYAASTQGVAGDTGPVIRPGEGVPAFVRRMAAMGADPGLAAIAAGESKGLHPRDVAKAGAVLDWLFLRDPAAAARLLAAALAGGPDALPSAAQGAGFPDLDALEEAWRRYAFDLLPWEPPPEPGGSWRVSKLDRLKAFPEAESVFAPLDRPVPGALWFGGRPFTCEVVEDGQAVRLWPIDEGARLRVVREPGVHPFRIAREYGGGLVEVRVDLRREGPSWTVRPADAVGGTVDGHALAFLDLDLDGRYGGFGRDAVLVGRSSAWVPLPRTLVLGGKAYEIRRVGPDGREIAWRSRSLPVRGADADALARWNAWRLAAGVVPLDVTDAATGPAASSVVGVLTADASSLAPALETWFGRPDTRALLLAPEAGRVTLSGSKGATVATLQADPDLVPGGFRGPVLGPPPGAEGVPTARRGEPEPKPLPITLGFRPGADLDALDVAVEVVGPDGAPLPTARLPAADAGSGLSVPPGTAAFLPGKPFAPRSTYKVSASFGRGPSRATRTWTFATGP